LILFHFRYETNGFESRWGRHLTPGIPSLSILCVVDIVVTLPGSLANRLAGTSPSPNPIVTALLALSERPYKTINRRKEINENWPARQLKPFELKSQQARPLNGCAVKVRGHYVAPIEKVSARYLGLSEASEPKSLRILLTLWRVKKHPNLTEGK
jgi:hypothetical protein